MFQGNFPSNHGCVPNCRNLQANPVQHYPGITITASPKRPTIPGSPQLSRSSRTRDGKSPTT